MRSQTEVPDFGPSSVRVRWIRVCDPGPSRCATPPTGTEARASFAHRSASPGGRRQRARSYARWGPASFRLGVLRCCK